MGSDTLESDAYKWLSDAKSVYVEGGLRSPAKAFFQTFQIDLSAPSFQRPMSQYGIPVLKGQPIELPPDKGVERPFSGLSRSGSISRSISFGNGQDAVLNSNFNLQLSGKISEKTKVKASISDNSLPVQADGFSQQIREFDQIFIELESEDFGRVRAGDIQLVPKKSLFLNFDKRVTGGLVETGFDLGEGRMNVTASGALARGRFHRNTFFGQEGNQGPYRLTGARGESFVLIISGSERVYIDGVLLQRGADADYIINYATGEISFTSLRPITRENRINVEFQYTDQAFLRSVFFGGAEYTSDKWSFNSQFFSEQDNADQPLQVQLSDDDRRALSDAGDDWENIRISTIRNYSGLAGEIPYRLTDSLGIDSILVYAPTDSVDLVTASFSDVGQGNGNYILEQTLGTGNVYRWVEPVNGLPQGRYEPIRQLQAPNQLQVFSQQVGYTTESAGQFDVEWAVSRFDENRISSRDKENDIGQAARLKWSQEKNDWNYTGEYQFNQKEFRTVERIRNVEFARDWNLRTEPEDLHLAAYSMGLSKDSTSFNTSVTGISSGTDYRGAKPAIGWNLIGKKTETRGKASWLVASDSTGSSDFARENFFFRRSFGHYHIGIKSQGEWNNASGMRANQNGNYNFFDNELFQEWGDSTAAFYARLGVFQRSDDSSQTEGQLQRNALARGLRSTLVFKPKTGGLASLYTQYRDLETPFQTDRPRRRTLTSRVQYQQAFAKKAIQWNSFYESGLSNEPLRSFTYIQVADGTGIYTWVDYNGNGIQELNEFEVAQLPGEADFLRIYTPNRQFQEAGRTLITQTIGIQPLAWVKSADKTPFWSRWSTQWNYSLENVNAFKGELNPLDPFYRPADDSLQLARRESNRISLFFNRTRQQFGGDYSYLDQTNRQIQAYGPETSTRRIHRFTLRFQTKDQLNFQPSWEFGTKDLLTPGFGERNYALLLQQISLRISWQVSTQLNFQTETGWRMNDNSDAEEYLEAFRQTFAVQYGLSGKSNLNAGLDYRSNAFTGSAFSPVGYEMLQGLLPGDNFLWNVYWEKQLFEFLQLNLRYDGRSSPGTEVIHTATMQVKALF